MTLLPDVNASRLRAEIALELASYARSSAPTGRHREGYLRDGERITEALLAAANCPRSAAFLERTGELRTRELERGREAEKHTGADREEKRYREDARVDADFAHARQTGRMQRNENRRAGEGERRAEHAAKHRKQDALGEQLLNEPRTRRTKRGPDGDLALPCVRARERQIRNVGARDQEDDADGRPRRTSSTYRTSPSTSCCARMARRGSMRLVTSPSRIHRPSNMRMAAVAARTSTPLRRRPTPMKLLFPNPA